MAPVFGVRSLVLASSPASGRASRSLVGRLGVRCPVSGVWCPVSGVRCPVSAPRRLARLRVSVSGVRCPVFGLWSPTGWPPASGLWSLVFGRPSASSCRPRCPVSGVRCPVSGSGRPSAPSASGARSLVFGGRCRCLVFGSGVWWRSRCPVSGVRCPVSGVWCLVVSSWCPVGFPVSGVRCPVFGGWSSWCSGSVVSVSALKTAPWRPLEGAAVVPAWCIVQPGVEDAVCCAFCAATASVGDARSLAFASHVTSCTMNSQGTSFELAAAVDEARSRRDALSHLFDAERPQALSPADAVVYALAVEVTPRTAPRNCSVVVF